jgi:hypothetical protein
MFLARTKIMLSLVLEFRSGPEAGIAGRPSGPPRATEATQDVNVAMCLVKPNNVEMQAEKLPELEIICFYS